MIQSLIKTTKGEIDQNINDRWELYLDYIKKYGKSELIDIEDNLAYSSEFDLYAIFYRKGIAERFHYPLMRLNGFRSPCDFDGSSLKLRLYDSIILDNVYTTYIVEK